MKKEAGIFEVTILALLYALLILGGIGTVREIVVFWTGLGLGFFALVFLYLKFGKIFLPPHFFKYLIFVLISLISISWSGFKGMSYEVSVLLASTIPIWVLSYSMTRLIRKINIVEYLVELITYVIYAFGILYIYHKIIGKHVSIYNFSLYLQQELNHNHVGDLAALGLLIGIIYYHKGRRNFQIIFLALFSFVLIILSGSRIAMLSVIFCLIFFYKDFILKRKKLLYFGILCFAIAFIVYGSTKSTLFSRDYYIQSLISLINNPVGIGLGNFQEASLNAENHLGIFSTFSKFTHNLILEILVGIGWLGLIFVWWLYKILQSLLARSKEGSNILTVMFLCVTIIFMTDYIYFTPAMLWLWFLLLGVSQGFIEKKTFKT